MKRVRGKRDAGARPGISLALGVTLAISFAVSCGSPAAGPAPGNPPVTIRYELVSVISGLSDPVDLQLPPDVSDRIFVVEQAGVVRVIQSGVLLPTPFIDIRGIVTAGGETGLLGLAFHPGYTTHRRFFLSYTGTVSGHLQSVIAEYQASASDPNVADTAERIVLTVDQPFDNHNGGQIQFGLDGFLYFGLGDGGRGGDPLGSGQDMTSLLGKLLRIDVDTTEPYAVPADNPFVGQAGIRPEIWASGFRNPWRFSFDRTTSRLFVADVGQNSFEEVNLVVKGGNYGWNIMEGLHCFEPPSGCSASGLELPIAEYGHSEGASVTGGFVYRGALMSELRGRYIFGDFISGRIWSLEETSPGVWTRTLLLDTDLNISCFGLDRAGELLVTDYGGSVFRLRKQS